MVSEKGSLGGQGARLFVKIDCRLDRINVKIASDRYYLKRQKNNLTSEYFTNL
jgi:hypothetical protein